MVLPLGFRRRTRKRLKRCKHERVNSLRVPYDDRRSLHCWTCGATAILPLPPVLQHIDDADAATLLRKELPAVIWPPVSRRTLLR